MINEFDLNIVSNITTYIKATKPIDKNLAGNKSFLESKSNLEVSQINIELDS